MAPRYLIYLCKLRQRVHDPDLRLERTLGNGYETGQKHIIEAHEPSTDSPPFTGGSLQRMSLEVGREPQQATSSR